MTTADGMTRQEFEAWYSDASLDPCALMRGADGEYGHVRTQVSWQAWQACGDQKGPAVLAPDAPGNADTVYRVAWVPGTDVRTVAGAIAAGGTLIKQVPVSRHEAALLAQHLNADHEGALGTYLVVVENAT